MSTYLMLEDHYINGQYMLAGTTQSTADVGGLLPTGWVPTPNVDPLDTAAVNAFYAAGPVISGSINIKPITYWAQIRTSDFSPANFSSIDFATNVLSNTWSLTGLGSNRSLYAPISI